MNFNIDQKKLNDILVKLVQIDSRNPSLETNAPGEAECAEYVSQILNELGLEVKLYKLKNKHINVVGILKGKGNGKSLMLNAHMDTVGIEGMSEPFSGKISNGRLYGRGSQDMKGSLASMLSAVKTIVDNNIKLNGDLIIAAVADEEYSSFGTEDLIKHHITDAAIITEPTDLSILLAHRGFIWYEVETIGKAAHGSRYDLGIDANMHMGCFLSELSLLEKELRTRDKHPLVGQPSLHASMINGGTDISTYSAKCNLKIERRTLPGETETQITKSLQNIINKLSKENPDFKATVKHILLRQPFENCTNSKIAKIAGNVIEHNLNRACKFDGGAFWTDAALLSNVGIDTIIVGPKGDGLHTEEEWVDLNSLYKLTNILIETAINYCK
ncbi:MAG: ArgE/DapE family deacylase [bacterium]|nr:ArgE/DapE family deacylase [bacterium]